MQRLELKIEKLNGQIAELDYTDTEKSELVLSEFSAAKSDLDAVTDEWMETQESLENIEL